MIIRKAENKDIKGITELLYQVADVHHKGRPDLFKGGVCKYTANELENIINDKNTPVLVAVDDKGFVLGHAFCVYKKTAETHVLEDRLSLYIDDICIDKNNRGKHIGSALCKAVQEMAKDTGCYNITLNVWCLNEGAMEFYKALGFKNQKITMEMLLE